MHYKKLSLLILALFAPKAYGLSHDDWRCTHGEHDHELPENVMLDVEEDFNPEGNDHAGRTLASYRNMRMTAYYTGLSGVSSTFKRYVQNDLIPPVLDFYQKALKVKYPVSGKLKTSAKSICGHSTPSALRSGINADFVLFVGARATSSYIASAGTCSTASGTKRPLMAKTTVSTTYMKATSDPILHEKQILCMMHEILHTLGWTRGQYSNWLDSRGRTLKGHILTRKAGGKTYTVINAEPLTSRVRSYFGCSSLAGAYMENTGSSGTAGIHLERQYYGFEYMTSGLISQMQVSEITFALLESTGWYVPDYGMTDSYHYGQGQGCRFYDTCSAKSFSEFCSSSSRACTNTGRGGGSCRTDSRSDNCKFVHPVDSYDCENPNAKNSARLPNLQTFGRGAGSKCFTGTLTSSSRAGSQTTFCFSPTCSGSSSSPTLTLKVGSKTVTCKKAGNVSVSGYRGTISCPDPKDFCKTVGKKVCPRGCMGRGSCVKGKCVCNRGFKGSDCAFKA